MYSFEKGANCVLLLHCEGADESTTVTDDSDSAHSPSVVESVEIDTDYYKFGSSSLLFTDGQVEIADHADFAMGSGRLTFECWIKHANPAAGSQNLFSQYLSSSSRWSFYYYPDSAVTGFYAFSSVAGAQTISFQTPVMDIDTDRWSHVALVRGWGNEDDDFAILVDGKLKKKETDSSPLPDVPGHFVVGGYAHSLDSGRFQGHMDEVRLLKGECAFMTEFTPAYKAYS